MEYKPRSEMLDEGLKTQIYWNLIVGATKMVKTWFTAAALAAMCACSGAGITFMVKTGVDQALQGEQPPISNSTQGEKIPPIQFVTATPPPPPLSPPPPPYPDQSTDSQEIPSFIPNDSLINFVNELLTTLIANGLPPINEITITNEATQEQGRFIDNWNILYDDLAQESKLPQEVKAIIKGILSIIATLPYLDQSEPIKQASEELKQRCPQQCQPLDDKLFEYLQRITQKEADGHSDETEPTPTPTATSSATPTLSPTPPNTPNYPATAAAIHQAELEKAATETAEKIDATAEALGRQIEMELTRLSAKETQRAREAKAATEVAKHYATVYAGLTQMAKTFTPTATPTQTETPKPAGTKIPLTETPTAWLVKSSE